MAAATYPAMTYLMSLTFYCCLYLHRLTKPCPFALWYLWFVLVSNLVIAMASVLEFREHTVVFTLSRGPQVSRSDFLPFLGCVKGRMEGFGTVGVGHVWHLTLKDPSDVDTLIDQGDFVVLSRNVSVTKLQSVLLTATLFWLPFWVPHSDVVDSFQGLLDDYISCTYVQIPQQGFQGCYSTQRKLRSPTDLT